MSSPSGLSSPPSPKPGKRKSLFDNPRNSIIPPPTEPIVVDQEKLTEEKENEEKQLYLDMLNTEKDSWRKVYNDARSKYNDLKWKLKHESQQPISLSNCYDLLDEDTKAFLAQKPDLDKLKLDAIECCREMDDILLACQELEKRKTRLMHEIDDTVTRIEKETLETSMFIL